MIERKAGETMTKVIKILKARNGLPTKILVEGEEYALVHKNYINGNKGKVKDGQK
ncbi:hypothetical protein [Metabacillus sp. Hm71]|uniref:hypothetical protein n=1 Tax=Metabacillus sp. Hm71 TaxID=3450743 RepID=UPI003F41E81E